VPAAPTEKEYVPGDKTYVAKDPPPPPLEGLPIALQPPPPPPPPQIATSMYTQPAVEVYDEPPWYLKKRGITGVYEEEGWYVGMTSGPFDVKTSPEAPGEIKLVTPEAD
jgi:hypothetical protein